MEDKNDAKSYHLALLIEQAGFRFYDALSEQLEGGVKKEILSLRDAELGHFNYFKELVGENAPHSEPETSWVQKEII